MDAIVETKGVVKLFPGVVALNEVDFVCQKGTVHCIVGENGAGKSTLVKILTGIYSPDKGVVFINGVNVLEHPDMFRKVAYAPQELQLFEHMTVAENLLLPLKRKDVNSIFYSKGKILKVAVPLLEKFHIFEKPDKIVHDISPSSKQLLQIARTLIIEGFEIVILDEPTTSLTIEDTKLLFKVIDQLRSDGKAVIYISHKLDEVFTIGDEVTVLRDGNKMGNAKVGGVDRKWTIKMMSGKDIDEKAIFRPIGERGGVVLDVEELSGPGIPGVSFQLHRGEILGFYGLVGAGRSEIMQTILGYRFAKGGKVRIDGKPLKLGNPIYAIKEGLVYLPEERKQQGIFPFLSVRHNVGVALGKKISNGILVALSKERSLTKVLVKTYNVKTSSIEIPIRFLSGGNQQKVIVGRSMFGSPSPKVIIFDEPTKGIDIMTKREIYRIMKELADEEKIGIILISSELEELLKCCNRLFTVYLRRITGEFDPNEAETSEIIAAAINAFGGTREASTINQE